MAGTHVKTGNPDANSERINVLAATAEFELIP